MVRIAEEESANSEKSQSNSAESMANPNDLDSEEVRREEEKVSGGDLVLAKKCESGVRGREEPPDDDCCAICFGDFEIPCKTSCGHWFCANCILMLWNYSRSVTCCKCPICSRLITKLTPEASLIFRRERETVKTLKKVESYNSLFVGGARGIVRKVLQLPVYLRVFFGGLLDPDRFSVNYHVIRIAAQLLAVLYICWGFDFIPIGSLGYRSTVGLFEDIANCLLSILYLVGFCRRYMLRRRVRLLANHHHPQQ